MLKTLHPMLGHITEKRRDLVCFSIVCDESTNVNDTVQLLTFVRGVDRNFTVTEELIAASNMHGTTKVVDIF
jgi:hypothetical protein